MDNVYRYPQDVYALDILSQAAMRAPDGQPLTASHHANPAAMASTIETFTPNLASNPNPSPARPLQVAGALPGASHHHQRPNNPHPHHISYHSSHTGVRPVPAYESATVGVHEYHPSGSRQNTMDTTMFMPSTTYSMDPGGYPSHLGILNTEQYHDGRSTMRERQHRETAIPFGFAAGPPPNASSEINESAGASGRPRKKRVRAEIAGGDDEDWASKKARGRPRVDTKDETAADRRRTQIRMAQRAYRHRKETTISLLEKQVQELRSTNEEMSNSFAGLFDFAVSKGLLQREPEFAQQLHSASQQMLALAKSTAAEEIIKEEDQGDEVMRQESVESEIISKNQDSVIKIAAQNSPSPVVQPEPVQRTWGAYQVAQEDSPAEQMVIQPYRSQEQRQHGEFQITSGSAQENSSSSFGLTDLQQYRAEVPTNDELINNFFQQSSLQAPSTYSFHERTFARQLHRATLEAASRLLSMAYPPESRFQEVFGFSLLYETRDAIRTRILKCATSSASETLQEWRAPFVHVGGAGTHYPMSEDDASLRPRFRTGLSMGPQSPAATLARDTCMQDDFRCSLPGFEGEFFDANDVEGYLRRLGLDIHPAAEYVTAEIDLLALTNISSTSSNSDSIGTAPSMDTPATPANKIHVLLVNTAVEEPNLNDLDFASANDKNASSDKNASYDKSGKPPITSRFQLDLEGWAESNAMNVANNDVLPPDSALQPDSNRNWNIQSENRRKVTISVKQLIKEILNHTVCLGRAPGYRPSDVNTAILAAIESSF